MWVCAGTQFGLVIYQSPFRQVLRKGQLVGVAGMSPLSGSYAGLRLYEWGDNQLGPLLRRFYGGIETIPASDAL